MNPSSHPSDSMWEGLNPREIVSEYHDAIIAALHARDFATAEQLLLGLIDTDAEDARIVMETLLRAVSISWRQTL